MNIAYSAQVDLPIPIKIFYPLNLYVKLLFTTIINIEIKGGDQILFNVLDSS